MFLFSFHACGLRLVDVMTLRWKDIDFKKKEIRKVQVKTRNRNTIPLSDPAIRILRKWKGRNKVYVFDLLSEDFDLSDKESLYSRRNSWNNTINTSLKALSKELGWKMELTFHVARHTWAVLALANGAAISEISRLLGHTTTGVTLFHKSTYPKFPSSIISPLYEYSSIKCTFYNKSLDNWKKIPTFASTVPATPLNNAYHGGTSSFL